MAVSADGERWFLLNASPEIRAADRELPRRCTRAAPRHSPIAGIVLTNGDLDHCLGLLSLRESHPLRVYATDARPPRASPRATCSTGRCSASPGS